MKSLAFALFMIPATVLLAQPGGGDQFVGDPVSSVQSGDWFDTTTWDCTCIPTSVNDVSIQSGHVITISVGDTARAEGVSIGTDAVLELPEEARVEVSASFASLGDVPGKGIVALVGEGNHMVGPATVEHLSCGTATVNVVDTLVIRGQLDLESSTFNTSGMLILEGHSGILPGTGEIIGSVQRKNSWHKLTTVGYFAGSGVEGAIAGSFLNGSTYFVKQWNEATTSYQSLTAEDELEVGMGHYCNAPAGLYEEVIQGQVVLESSLMLPAESSSESWRGWNIIANPLTGFADMSRTTIQGSESMGATYHWVDSLSTYAVQMDGAGLFGRKGVLLPGDAFFVIIDTTSTLEFGSDALVDKHDWENQFNHEAGSTLLFQLEKGGYIEQSLIDFGQGSDTYDRSEDAKFLHSFRGRNNLDLFSMSADDIPLAINRTAGGSQVIPIWVKALDGDVVTITAESTPENMCLQLEDIVTGWTGSVYDALEYAFTVEGDEDHHRFNLIVEEVAELVANSIPAACGSSQDGMISFSGPEQSSGYMLVDALGNEAGEFIADSLGGTFSGLFSGTYILSASMEGCANMVHEVEVGAGDAGWASFNVQAMPDHIGCYDDHGGVSLEIDGGQEPYTVEWSHGATGADITVEAAGVLEAVITDAAGCSDSTTVEVLAAPQVQAGIALENAVVALVDGEAEVHFGNASSGATAYQWNFGDGGSSTSENPIHMYTAAGAYTVGLNAWNDYCSDTYQMVVTVETVSSIGGLSESLEAAIERTSMGWEVSHPSEAFEVEVFDLTGRIVQRTEGLPGEPVLLDAARLPHVALVHWHGTQSDSRKTWRLGR